MEVLVFVVFTAIATFFEFAWRGFAVMLGIQLAKKLVK